MEQQRRELEEKEKRLLAYGDRSREAPPEGARAGRKERDRGHGVEDDEIPDATVEYDKSVEWCEIALPSQQATLRATANSFLLVLPKPSTPGHLLKSLFEFQMALSSHLGNLNLQETPSQ